MTSIVSWNVNGLRARLDYLVRWLDDRQPDIVGLQELKLEDDGFPHDAFASRGYTVVTHGQKAWNGVAILAREPMTVVQRGLPGQDAFGARLLTVDVGGLLFSTVYCPNGKSVDHADYPLKLVWFDALVAHWRSCCPVDRPAVLCGDFNITPEDSDSWHPDGFTEGIFHTPAERERMFGLVDLGAALVHGNEKGLRQPGRTEGCGQVDQRAVGRADHGGWVFARWILFCRPFADLLYADRGKL
jgi:exodeoxyribonuclease III